MEQSIKIWEEGAKSRESEDRARPSKIKHCWEENWRPEETGCPSSERPSANATVKNSQGLHHRDDVDRLYVSRKEGGLASIEDSVDASIQRLEDYIQKHEGGLITATRNDTKNTMNNRMTITRKQKWEGKQVYGRFNPLINNISHDKTWTRLRKGNFKRETESPLTAAQDNAVRTNHIKVRINKTQQNSKCKLCGDRDKTINYISESSKLAQKEYKTRHDWVAQVIH